MDEKPFDGVVGDTAELRIAEKVLALRQFELNQKEIAKKAGVSRQTAAVVLKKFVDMGIITSTERGREIHYKLNEHNPLSYALDILNGAILEGLTGQDLLDRFPRIELADKVSFRKLEKDAEVQGEIKASVA